MKTIMVPKPSSEINLSQLDKELQNDLGLIKRFMISEEERTFTPGNFYGLKIEKEKIGILVDNNVNIDKKEILRVIKEHKAEILSKITLKEISIKIMEISERLDKLEKKINKGEMKDE